MEQKEIRFIDSKYNELFRIPDGSYITLTYPNGDISIKPCNYIDDYHTVIDNKMFHICGWCEQMERNGIKFAPTIEADHIRLSNEKLIEKNLTELEKDKFFMTDNGFTEVYYNPDADAGGQIVYNEISFDLIKEAAHKHRNTENFFNYLASGCTQYLIDINTPEFKGNFESFVNRKADLENCNSRTMAMMKKAAGLLPEKMKKAEIFER